MKQRVTIAVLLVVTIWAASAGVIYAASPLGGDLVDVRLRAADKGLAWLASMQHADGGFGPGGSSDWLSTALTVQAFLARGEDAASLISASGKGAGDYLAAQAGSVASDSYQLAHMILAAIALGHDPTTFAGRNWLNLLNATYQADGRYASSSAGAVEAQSLAFLALRAAYQPVPAAARTWLRNAARSDGGWGTTPAGPSDAYHTGIALQALIQAGEPITSTSVIRAVAYLRERQTADGGFARAAGIAQSDVLSTSAAVQGLVAAGERLLDASWKKGDWSPFDALLAMQSSNGAFALSLGGPPDIAATVAGVQGLIARPLAARERGTATLRALEWLHTQQRTDGSFDTRGTVTADAVYVIALAGQDPAGPAWTRGGISALAALEAKIPTLVGGSGDREADAGKAARAAVAAGRDPRAFGGYDLVARIQSFYDPTTGRYHPTHLFRNDLAILGLAAAGEAIPDLARQALVNAQGPSGGWGWASPSTPDMDTTGLTMCALVAAGHPREGSEFARATAFMAGWQFADGSLPDKSIATTGNSNSTALAIQGLLAAGRDPRDPPFVVMTPSGALVHLLDALLSFQEDSGAFAFKREYPENRLLAVLDAVPALLGAFPAYQPRSETSMTVAGQARIVRQANRYVLIVPYTGDGNDNGTLLVRWRSSPAGAWSAPISVSKTAVAYWTLLAVAGSMELRVEFQDVDGVEGPALQTLYLSRAYLPAIRKR